MFGLPLLPLLPLLIAGLVAVVGLSSCMYKNGRDSRDGEVQELRVSLDVAKADNASLARDVARKDEIIVRQNVEVERLETIGKTVRGLQATIRKESQERETALAWRLAALSSQASSGTEAGVGCPKTYGILGDLADTVRGEQTVPVAAAPKPATSIPPPVTGVTPPRPVLPAKPLPPAIRVKP